MKLHEIARLRRSDARKLLDSVECNSIRLPQNKKELLVQRLNSTFVISNLNGVFIVSTERGNP
jgi:hypothetical protein